MSLLDRHMDFLDSLRAAGLPEAAVTLVEDLDRDISKLEKEVEQTRLREQKDRELLASGAVPAKQLTEIEHELRGLERRQSVLEDEELELMEKREAVELDQQRAEATVNATNDEIAAAQRRREETVKDIDVATTALPDETIRRSRAAGFKTVPTGVEHGTVTVVIDGHPALTTEGSVGAYPSKIPMIDVVTVGAGGGSSPLRAKNSSAPSP